MKKTVYIEVTTTDPTFNLALEEYVFEKMSRDREYFLTWRNDNAIIVGRHQNTAAEINAEFVKEKNIKVVRRLSGGGAVYRGEPDEEHHAAGNRAASGQERFQPFAFPAAGRDHLQETADRKTSFTCGKIAERTSGDDDQGSGGPVRFCGRVLFFASLPALPRPHAWGIQEEAVGASGILPFFYKNLFSYSCIFNRRPQSHSPTDRHTVGALDIITPLPVDRNLVEATQITS